MGCCAGIIRYLFGLVTLAIFLGGCGLLAVGIYSLVSDGASFGELIDSDLLTGTAILLIIAGSLVVIVSFFGCCGAFKESTCMLGTYFCLVLVLFVIVVAGAITGFVLGGGAIEDGLHDVLVDSLKNYDNTDAAKDSWDAVQQDFECCGVDGRDDYRKYVINGMRIPDSCGSYDVGCYKKVVDFIDENSRLFGAIGLVVAAFLFLSMIFSCTIRSNIKSGHHSV